MNVYIISDTHGNIGMVDVILELSADADLVIHLGDDYRDAIPFIDAKIPLIGCQELGEGNMKIP